MAIIKYDEWVTLQNPIHMEACGNVIPSLGFKGYLSDHTDYVDGDFVKTRAFESFDELLKYDFSDCYLHALQPVHDDSAIDIRNTQLIRDPQFIDNLLQQSLGAGSLSYIPRIRYAGDAKLKELVE